MRKGNGDNVMSRRSRIRRIAKWSGVVVCAGLVTVWVVSLRWSTSAPIVTWKGVSSHTVIRMEPGCLLWYTAPDRSWTVGSARGRASGSTRTTQERSTWLVWWPRVFSLSFGIGARLPLWIPVFIVALPTGYLFYRDPRYPPGHCQGCGYNLKGNVSGVCPECGRTT